MQLCAIFYAVYLSLLSRVMADVSITSPGLSQRFSGSGGSASVNIKWEDDSDDSSDDASLDKVQSYSIVLCTGANSGIQALGTLSTSVSKTATSYTASISASDYPNGIYFIQIYAKFASGYTIHYTPRFTLSGMEGDASTLTFRASLLSVTGDGPSAQVNVGDGAATSPVDSKSFTVPYVEQTGRTRYAPMQTQPGSSISYTQFSNRHSTSAYTPYSTFRASPDVFSTITAGWNYTPASKVNSAPVAPFPTYFYPASSRVSAATLSSANKKRWI